MRNIGANPPKAEVGVATENGRSYYQITSLLRQSRVPYVDVIIGNGQTSESLRTFSGRNATRDYNSLKVIVTTRKERLQLAADKVICIEDLGQDSGLARERLIPLLSPKESENLTIGIDPGKRIGLASYINDLEIESIVLGSLDEVIERVGLLIENADGLRKTIKIGSGIPALANQIASIIDQRFGAGDLRIKLVDERGTSALNAFRSRSGTRDQQAARLIAFRDGSDFRR